MTVGTQNLSQYSYNGFASGMGGKLYVPVNPSNVVYAQFDHISGIAAKSGQNGVSISKIKILNTLIDNLSKIKADSKKNLSQSSIAAANEEKTHLTDEQVDALIESYQKQIQDTMAQAQNAPYILTGRPETAALFSIEV